MYTVQLSSLIDKMKLENLTPEINTAHIKISQPDVNRPALQLSGFFDYFDSERVQVIGNVENSYMHHMERDHGYEILSKLMDCKVPCIVFCRNIEVSAGLLQLAVKKGVPLLRTAKTTSSFMAEVIRWLNEELAPRIKIHGVLVDVYGEGLLIMGNSGIGKSEAALELIKRGHRLVADESVEIKRISDDSLIGIAPDITRHLIELRGIGVIDVKTLFGVESVKNSQAIDLIIKLEEWDKNKTYDNYELDEQYTELLGNKVRCYTIPMGIGRNLAGICESAAVNHRKNKMD